MLLFIILALGIHRLYPWREIADIRSPLVAVVFIGAAISIAVWARSLFVAANTTLIPASPMNNALVVQGPYRFSRNPMYLAIVMFGIGVSFFVGSIPMFLAPIAVFLLCDRVFIPFEEAKMLRQFGETYASYTRRVRRWI
jgi:protein-S-isoprenylcysteine O-methyltransferase Ste14